MTTQAGNTMSVEDMRGLLAQMPSPDLVVQMGRGRSLGMLPTDRRLQSAEQAVTIARRFERVDEASLLQLAQIVTLEIRNAPRDIDYIAANLLKDENLKVRVLIRYLYEVPPDIANPWSFTKGPLYDATRVEPPHMNSRRVACFDEFQRFIKKYPRRRFSRA